MYYLYVLKGGNEKLYVGRTGNLRRRLIEHRNGKTWTTRRMGNLELIFYEAYKAKQDSIRREKYLKTNKGKKNLKLILRESLK